MQAQRLATTSRISLSGVALAALVAGSIALGAVSGAAIAAAVESTAHDQAGGAMTLAAAHGQFDAVSFRAGERSLDWRPTFDAVRFRAGERSLDGNS